MNQKSEIVGEEDAFVGSALDVLDSDQEEQSESVTESSYQNDSASFRQKATPHVHWICIVFLYIAASLLVAIVVIRFSHLCLPVCCRWMSHEDLAQVDKLLAGGGIGLAVGVFREQILAIIKV